MESLAIAAAMAAIDFGIKIAMQQLSLVEGRVVTEEEALQRYRDRDARRDDAIADTPGG